VAFFLTPEKLQELWVIPIWFIIVTALSMLVGSVLGSLFRLRQSQRSFVTAASMFMNSNALPIALMQSLVVSVPDLKWGNDDNKDGMLGRALTYLTMYSTLGMVLRYSYGIKLLSRADTILQPEGNAEERTPLLGDGTVLTSPPSSSTLVSDIEGYRESDCQDSNQPFKNNASLFPPANQNQAKFYNSFPNSPNDSRPVLPRYDSTSDTDIDDEAILPTHSQSKHCLHYPWRFITRAIAILNSFMTVPLWSALLSLLVACIEPLKHALLNHLQPVNNAINNAGKCSVPLTLVVLGAYFYAPDESTKTFMQSIRDIFRCKSAVSQETQENRTKPNPGETKTVILSVASRMIITPLILIPGMTLATKYDWHEVFQDPVFVVINVILVCSPPALTLAQITQAVSGNAFERLISRTIFWSYCIFTPPVMILSVLLALVLAKQ